MTLEELKNEIAVKGYITIRQAMDFSRKNLKQGVSYDEYGEPSEEGRVEIHELAKIVIKSNQSGDEDDYHNYAVLFGVMEENTTACDILLCGMKKFPRNVDLMADFLLYAISSNDNHYHMCAEIYERLLKINKKRWSWRAFNFSISYMLSLVDRDDSIDEDELKEKMLTLAHEYQQYHPKSELGYVAQARIMKKFGERDEENAILVKACENDSMHAPRSAMMLAENSFGKKEYDIALNYFQRLQSEQIDQLYNVSAPGRAYMLSFLTKTAQFLQETSGAEYNNENDKRVREIHRDYKIAKKLKSSQTQLETAKQYITLIEVMSGIPFNDDDDTED